MEIFETIAQATKPQQIGEKVVLKTKEGQKVFHLNLPYHTKWINPFGDGKPSYLYKITKKRKGLQVESIGLHEFPTYSEDCLANALSEENEFATGEEWKEALEKVYHHIHGQLI